MSKSLKYFMRDEAKQEIVVTVPGLESIKDEKGNIIDFEIKTLSNKRVTEINDMYKSRVPAKDKKGNYITQNGEVVFKTDKDSSKAFRHVICESLVYPELRDPELMKFFNCVDITEMPFHVFPTSAEYSYISKKVLEVLGLVESEDQDVEEAKN